nr:helix-turn-helix domain-containing protein [uncultured Eisenbergiella sp.]
MSDYREKDFLTVEEVAGILRIGKSKCYDLVKSPDCPFRVLPVGRLIRVPANNFFNWYDSFAEQKEFKKKRGN